LLDPENIEGIVIVQLPEKINSTNNRAFEKDLAPWMEPNAKVVFDLTQVKHLDSSGLGSIMASLKHLRTAGGDLKLCGLSKQIRALFELVRMHHVFDIFNTRQEAIDSYK
jgi:anti-sigma B factor antagonist